MAEEDEMLHVLAQLCVRPAPEVERYRSQVTYVLLYLVEKYVKRGLDPNRQRLHCDLDASRYAFADAELRAHIIPFIQQAIVGRDDSARWTRPLVDR